MRMVKIVVGYIGRLAAASLSPLHADRSTTGVCNVTYLPLHGEEDGPSGGVVEHPVAPDTEIGALGLQHDGAVSVVVGDGEVAAGEAHGLLGHRQRHHVRRAELRGHHRHRGRRRRRRRRRRASVVGRRHHIPQIDRRRLVLGSCSVDSIGGRHVFLVLAAL